MNFELQKMCEIVKESDKSTVESNLTKLCDEMELKKISYDVLVDVDMVVTLINCVGYGIEEITYLVLVILGRIFTGNDENIADSIKSEYVLVLNTMLHDNKLSIETKKVVISNFANISDNEKYQRIILKDDVLFSLISFVSNIEELSKELVTQTLSIIKRCVHHLVSYAEIELAFKKLVPKFNKWNDGRLIVIQGIFEVLVQRIMKINKQLKILLSEHFIERILRLCEQFSTGFLNAREESQKEFHDLLIANLRFASNLYLYALELKMDSSPVLNGFFEKKIINTLNTLLIHPKFEMRTVILWYLCNLCVSIRGIEVLMTENVLENVLSLLCCDNYNLQYGSMFLILNMCSLEPMTVIPYLVDKGIIPILEDLLRIQNDILVRDILMCIEDILNCGFNLFGDEECKYVMYMVNAGVYDRIVEIEESSTDTGIKELCMEYLDLFFYEDVVNDPEINNVEVPYHKTSNLKYEIEMKMEDETDENILKILKYLDERICFYDERELIKFSKPNGNVLGVLYELKWDKNVIRRLVSKGIFMNQKELSVISDFCWDLVDLNSSSGGNMKTFMKEIDDNVDSDDD
eukprot:TRINITY_DN3209_c1_g11_i1.p1 TRINITY_DN3209_c1_g11~~TRINITY_DN3209_c1_g11_i1.p1  ORF type:complete len:578 (+),score=128.48 TRINITY_DN3209_c1_g11_i1:123-1856(+)